MRDDDEAELGACPNRPARENDPDCNSLENQAQNTSHVSTDGVKANGRLVSSLNTSMVRMHEAFFNRATSCPNLIAVQDDDGKLTYGQLASAARRRAARLAAAGVGQNSRCVLLGERSNEHIVNMLALSLLGAVQAVIDQQYPPARILELIKMVQPVIVVCNGNCSESLGGAIIGAGWKVVTTDYSEQALWEERLTPPSERDIAYILFTSGTTGRPKMLGIGHGALASFVHWQSERFKVTSGDRVAMLSGLSHDPVLRDIFLPLSTGATLTIPRQAYLSDPHALADWLLRAAPTIIHTTPPMGRIIISAFRGSPRIPSLRCIFWGGDILGSDVTSAFRSANPSLKQINFYGSTETPQAICFHVVGAADLKAEPIGQPIPNVEAQILDDDGNATIGSTVGQLVVRTPYRVFEADKDGGFHRLASTYRTGDRAYRNEHGDLIVVGRNDDQIKVRGYRVELGEVAEGIMAIDGVTEAVALKDASVAAAPRIVAHIAPMTSDPDAVLCSIRERLPSYMVPSEIHFHECLPRLPNGKIDRLALASHAIAAAVNNVSTANISDMEHRIVDAVAAAVKRNVTDLNMPLAMQGLDSLSSIQLQLALEEIVTDLPEDWSELSIAQLASMAGAGLQPQSGWHAIFGLTRLELSPIFRALATFLIVALHFHWFSNDLGTTSVLFLIAGYSLYRFQIQEILKSGSALSILRSLGSILALAIPVQLAVYGAQTIKGAPTDLSTIFFYANFRDFYGEGKNAGAVVWLWFLHCYIQIYLGLFLLLKWRSVQALMSTHGWLMLYGLFGVLVTLRFGVPAILDDDFAALGSLPGTKWDQLPTTHAPTVALGMLAAMQERLVGKMVTLCIAIGYAIIAGAYFPNTNPVVLIAAVGLLQFVRSIRLPRLLARVALLISSASLFIYLMHLPMHALYTMTGLQGSAGFKVMLVMLVSPFLWRIWSAGYDLFSNAVAFHRRPENSLPHKRTHFELSTKLDDHSIGSAQWKNR